MAHTSMDVAKGTGGGGGFIYSGGRSNRDTGIFVNRAARRSRTLKEQGRGGERERCEKEWNFIEEKSGVTGRFVFQRLDNFRKVSSVSVNATTLPESPNNFLYSLFLSSLLFRPKNMRDSAFPDPHSSAPRSSSAICPLYSR